jgi:dTMP kinase
VNYKGLFIVFEGANAAGKSTAMREVARELAAQGHEIVSTREPGGSQLAEHLRGLLLDPAVDIDAHEQALLLMAGRRNHLRTVIIPALERGAIVLCDRFVASTLVYQTVPRGQESKMTVAEVVETHKLHCLDMKPDAQFTLCVSNEVAQERKRLRFGEIDRFESDDAIYEQACIDRYKESGLLLGFNQIDIDANGTPERTIAQILRHMRSIIGSRSIQCSFGKHVANVQ